MEVSSFQNRLMFSFKSGNSFFFSFFITYCRKHWPYESTHRSSHIFFQGITSVIYETQTLVPRYRMAHLYGKEVESPERYRQGNFYSNSLTDEKCNFFQFSCSAERLRLKVGVGGNGVNVKFPLYCKIFIILSFKYSKLQQWKKADPGFMKKIKKQYMKISFSWNESLQFSESLKRPDVFLLKAASLFSF